MRTASVTHTTDPPVCPVHTAESPNVAGGRPARLCRDVQGTCDWLILWLCVPTYNNTHVVMYCIQAMWRMATAYVGVWQYACGTVMHIDTLTGGDHTHTRVQCVSVPHAKHMAISAWVRYEVTPPFLLPVGRQCNVVHSGCCEALSLCIDGQTVVCVHIEHADGWQCVVCL